MDNSPKKWRRRILFIISALLVLAGLALDWKLTVGIVTAVMLIVTFGYYIVVKFGALLRKLAEEKKHCFFAKMEQVVRVDTGEGDFHRFYYFSDKYRFTGDDAKSTIGRWKIKKKSQDDLRGTIEHFNFLQRFIYRKYGIVWFQGWLFQRSIHFYKFDRSELELDQEAKSYTLVTYANDMSPYYFTKQFPLAFYVKDAEDKHAVPVDVYFTIYGYIENPYMASILVDNYPDLWQQKVLGAASQLIGQESLLLLAVDDSKVGKDKIPDEITKDLAGDRKAFRDKFAQTMRSLSDKVNKDPKAGLRKSLGVVITDADVNSIEPGSSLNKEEISKALMLEFTARMEKRASAHIVERKKNEGLGEQERLSKKLEALASVDNGVLFGIAEEIKNSKIQTLVLDGQKTNLLVSGQKIGGNE